ncbi:GmrSD restriction endonuclease domain-containing protein [Streptomonospora litoralis]|uniref:GmrSD restriction endonucleases N-terminal domain-containing protein n=1 Tax=Streptomonospora litoralis TaxID=2498135 RepID=A0A4P6PZI0_9ACTN|nr:DUF262 domain-containing protein [Streptomonospora litoralis]QBI53658.1 hypothetical protein EKD16_09320 [Streptomonospora litoralis]
MAKLSMLLDQIESGTVLLPAFQRGYVWNREQVRNLMSSIYQGHPVGGLLMWETATDVAVTGGIRGNGTHLLLLDGQQRMTTLYAIIRGRPPAFFHGDEKAFNDLYFNVDTEKFQFYAPTKMNGDDRWINVSELFASSPVDFYPAFADHPDAKLYLQRLNQLSQITKHDFHQEEITGADMNVDKVVEIFNTVNSGGTKLSKGDLALAQRCAKRPETRQDMREYLDRWEGAGFSFSLDWLLRNATAVAMGRALFSSLEGMSAADFDSALRKSVDHIDAFLDAASGRLGLDHHQVLMGRYAIPVISRLLSLDPSALQNSAHRDRVLFWYIHAALRGRFSGSTETTLQVDYDAAKTNGVDGLIDTLERSRGGTLDIHADDFEAFTRGSRFYPLLYMLTRVKGARDFGSGLELKAESLGKLTSLEMHHIFPKALLDKGPHSGQVNAIANFCFLTQKSNLEIGKKHPQEYFAEVEERHPGALASQWIPTDPDLWRVERYPDFLQARRELLAQAAREFLGELRDGGAPSGQTQELTPVQLVTDAADDDPRAVQIRELIEELQRNGCAEPLTDAGISDPDTGRELAVAEAFWPDGLQPGQGRPVVLELDSDQADVQRLKELDYDVFTSPDALLGFVNRQHAEAAGGGAANEPDAQPRPQDAAEASVPDASAGDGALLREFGSAMRRVYQRALDEAGYRAPRFLGMLADIGPLETARRLLNAPAVSDCFAELWERGRLDLTVEALVLDERFAPLFTDAEATRARTRLEQFGYTGRAAARG